MKENSGLETFLREKLNPDAHRLHARSPLACGWGIFSGNYAQTTTDDLFEKRYIYGSQAGSLQPNPLGAGIPVPDKDEQVMRGFGRVRGVEGLSGLNSPSVSSVSSGGAILYQFDAWGSLGPQVWFPWLAHSLTPAPDLPTAYSRQKRQS